MDGYVSFVLENSDRILLGYLELDMMNDCSIQFMQSPFVGSFGTCSLLLYHSQVILSICFYEKVPIFLTMFGGATVKDITKSRSIL